MPPREQGEATPIEKQTAVPAHPAPATAVFMALQQAKSTHAVLAFDGGPDEF